MPNVGPPPYFHGKTVPVDYSVGTPRPEIVDAEIHELVTRLDAVETVDEELVIAILELVARHRDITAQLIGQTARAFVFTARRQYVRQSRSRCGGTTFTRRRSPGTWSTCGHRRRLVTPDRSGARRLYFAADGSAAFVVTGSGAPPTITAILSPTP